MGFRGEQPERGYWWRMGLTGSLGISMALVSYLYGSDLERDLEAREFQRLAQVQQQNAQELLHRSTQLLHAFRGFLAATPRVDRDGYARFAAEVLPQHPEIYAMHWAPKIEPAQRAAFEADIGPFQPVPLGIFDVDDAARRAVPARARERYFPVQYAEPLSANRKVIGLDTLERPSNQMTIRAAGGTASQRITPVFPLIQDPDGPLATALYQPVFAEGLPLDGAEGNWQALEGFLILMLRPGLLLEGMPFGEFEVALRLYDLQDGEAVAIHPRGARMLAPAENVVQLPLQVPGRTWIMEFVARDGFGQRIHLQPLLLMLSLLLLTAVSLVFLKRSHHAALALREANGELLLRQQELDGLAHRDSLTGLANRLLLCDRINLALASLRRQGGGLAVCLLDLDGFKAINDRFGHASGDRVLREVAGRLQAVVRSSDTVARLGGDEFVLLLPGMSAAKSVQRLIQLLIEQVHEPIALGEEGPLVAVSASIGIAFADAHQDAQTLLHQADAAMYQAKSAGKNCYRIFATVEAPRAEAHEA